MWITISLQGIFCLKHFSCLMSIVFLTNKMVVHQMKNQRFLCSNWKLRLSSSSRSSTFLESATYLSIVCDCVNQISTWHRRICLFVCFIYIMVYACTHSWLFELYILRQVALKRQQAVEDAIAMRLVSNETGKAIDALPPGKIFGMSITEPSATPSESNTNDNLLLVQKTKIRKFFLILIDLQTFSWHNQVLLSCLPHLRGFFSSFW